jgi:hypothetical protein
MSMIFSGTSDEHGSPFLERHERIAAEWTAFAAENGAEVHGNYNALFFEAQIDIIAPNGSWSIKGHIHQSTIAGGIPLDSPVHMTTKFIGHLRQYEADVHFSIGPKGPLYWLTKHFRRWLNESGIAPDLMVRTKDLSAYRGAISGYEQTIRDLGFCEAELTVTGTVTARSKSLISTKDKLARSLDLLSRITAPAEWPLPERMGQIPQSFTQRTHNP